MNADIRAVDVIIFIPPQHVGYITFAFINYPNDQVLKVIYGKAKINHLSLLLIVDSRFYCITITESTLISVVSMDRSKWLELLHYLNKGWLPKVLKL